MEKENTDEIGVTENDDIVIPKKLVVEPEMFSFEYESSWKVVNEVLNSFTEGEATEAGIARLRHDYEKNKQLLKSCFPPNGRLVRLVGNSNTSPLRDDSPLFTHYAKQYARMQGDLVMENSPALEVWRALFAPQGKFMAEVNYALSELSCEEQEIGRLLKKRIVSGTRLDKDTKIVRWVCLHVREEFSDVTGNVRKLLEKALTFVVEGLSVCVRKGTTPSYVVLSVNPLDILLASESTTSWTSCLSLDGHYCASTLAYLTCQYTAIQYAYKEVAMYSPSGHTLPRKAWRQWVYIEKIGALQMRHYPNEAVQYAYEGRRLIGEVLSKLGSSTETYKVFVRKKNLPYLHNPYEGAYIDAQYDHAARMVSLIHSGTESGPDTPRPEFACGIGGEALCLLCGNTLSKGEKTLICCLPVHCHECGLPVEEGLRFPENDENVYCRDCYDDLFAPCDGCGDVLEREEAQCFQDNIYCDGCFSATFVHCESCHDVLHREDALYYKRTFRSFPYCEHCYEERFVECYLCQEVFRKADVADTVCKTCLHDKENKEVSP